MRKTKIARLLSMSIFATAIFGAATYADATNISVGTQEDWYTALATMHQSTNSEFTITLTDDINITTAINSQQIDNKNTVTIIGNSHSLTFNVDAGKINVSDATLNLGRNGQNDVLKIKGAGPTGNSSNSLIFLHTDAVLNMYANTELSDNYHDHGALTGGGVLMYDNSIFNMYGGSIHDNAVQTWGGAICMDYVNGAEFHMYDGEIYNNIVDDYYGGAIVIGYGSSSTIDIQGGTIRNNSAPYGGAITISSASTNSSAIIKNATIKDNVGVGTNGAGQANGGAGGIIVDGGTLTIENSIIEGNTYNGKGTGGIRSDSTLISKNNIYRNNTSTYYGGAVEIADSNGYGSTFTSTNDKIYGNSAMIGGGVFLLQGTADLSTTEVYNNKASYAGNDYFINSSVTSAKIIPAANMTGYATYGSTETNLKNWYRDADTRFDVDNPTAVVDPANVVAGSQYALTAAGEVVYTIKFDVAGGSAVDDIKVIVGETTTAPTDPTKDGYVFKGWYTDDTYETEFDFTASVTANATAYAKWEEAPAPDPDPTPDPEPAPTPTPENPSTHDDVMSYIITFAISMLGLGVAFIVKR